MNKIAIIAAAMALFVGCSDDSGSNPATENAPKMTCIQEKPWLYNERPDHEVGSCQEEYERCYAKYYNTRWDEEHNEFVYVLKRCEDGNWTEKDIEVKLPQTCNDRNEPWFLEQKYQYENPYIRDSLAKVEAENLCWEYTYQPKSSKEP